MGVLVTLAICGTVMLNTAVSGLATVLADFPPDIIESVVAGTAGDTFESLPPDVRSAALDVIVGAINTVYIVALSTSSVGFVCSLFLKHERIFVGNAKGQNGKT